MIGIYGSTWEIYICISRQQYYIMICFFFFLTSFMTSKSSFWVCLCVLVAQSCPTIWWLLKSYCILYLHLGWFWGFSDSGASLMAQMVKNLPGLGKIQVQSLSWEDLLEKIMATHSSILTWRIPWTEESWGRKQSDSTEWLTLSLPVCLFSNWF